MAHSLNKIYVHTVFRTKYKEPLITEEIEKNLYPFFKNQLVELGCYSIAINGIPDHVHLLFLLSPKKSISDVAKQLKGSSSHWINELKLTKQKFQWQTGYGCFSVSEFHVETISNYIQMQKEHHKIKKYENDGEELLYLNCKLNP